MANQRIFLTAWTWFTSEGFINGKPSLYRGRQIPPQLIGDPSLPKLCVIDYSFPMTDDGGLPTTNQYAEIGEFERRFIDKLEAAQVGILAFVRTHNGNVRYFTYVSSAETAAQILTDMELCSPQPIELAAKDDPDWNEYRVFLRGAQPK
jgi:hypothetical protein